MAEKVTIKYENRYGETREAEIMMEEGDKVGRRIHSIRLLPPNCQLKAVKRSNKDYKFK